MTTRELPRDEWHRLSGTLLDQAWPKLSPASRVLVVENEGQIVACTSCLPAWHLDGTWVHPDFRRNGAVDLALLRGMKKLVVSLGVNEVVMMACNPEQKKLCAEGGTLLGDVTLLDCDHYAIHLGGA